MAERRLLWLAGIVLVWGAAIAGKLVMLQLVHHQDYVDKARARQEQVVQLRAQRGAIFDRTGQALALSVHRESVYIDPVKMPSLELAADVLGRALHLNSAELYRSFQSGRQRKRRTLWVKRDITPKEAEDIRTLKTTLDWIYIDSGSDRHYPNDMLAAHLLGGVDFEEKGNGGIEQALERDLSGAPGKSRILTDVRRRGVDELSTKDAVAGSTLVLTIDQRLQFVAEREIAEAVKKHMANSGSVVVMNPYDGAILAMASYPAYDPNQPPVTDRDIKARSNHAVSVPFEPGSVFKVITLAAALETTRLTPDSIINCNGGILRLPGRVIHDSHAGLWNLTMRDVLAHSSNIGAIQIGMTVGREKMFDYMKRFGFGQKSGIPLPAESKGRVRPLNVWGTTSLASVSMGQEVSVTTLQLARAAAVIANGGLLVKPRLILKKNDQTVPVEPPVRAIKPETAITMRQLMENVVINGTGKEARLSGYTAGGKTGSAQIYDYASHHYTHTYNGSFMGMAPVTNPQVVVVVTLNGTRGNGGFGGVVAAPVFKVVATEALRILDVPKDVPEEEPVKSTLAKAQSLDDASDPDTRPGQSNVLEDPDEDVVGPKLPAMTIAQAVGAGMVPNFRGKTLRTVLKEASALGLAVQPDGSGIARLQNPPAGSTLHQGERIRVQFAR